jgi:hypothetical protein
MSYPERLLITTPSTVSGAINDPFITGTAEKCTYTPRSAILFPPGTKFAVEQVSLSLSYANITAANNQLGYRTAIGNSTKWLPIPAGSNFGVSDLNAILQQTMFINGDISGTTADPIYNASMVLQNTSGEVQVILSNSYCLDVSSGSLWQNLGMAAPAVISFQGSTVFPNKCAINTVNMMLVYSNIASANLNGSAAAGTIAAFPQTVAPWNQQTYTPPRPQFQTLAINPITNINITLYDQTGLNVLVLNGQPMTISLVFEVPPMNPMKDIGSALLEFIALFKKKFLM